MRIAEEKETIKRIKAAESKRKFAAKEKSIEGIKKFGSFANNIVGKVTAPIKSVFDKIKEFFGLILTGIVTNAVFTWLGNEENRGKLETIFKWVGRVFTGLLLAVITGKFIKWGIRLFKLVRFFWRLPGKIKSLFNGLRGLIQRLGKSLGFKPKPTGPSPTVDPRLGKPKPKPTPLRELGKPAAPRPGAGTILGPSGKPIGTGLEAYKGAGSAPARAPSIPKPSTPSLKPKFKLGRGGIIGTISLTLAQLFAPQIQEMVGGLYNQMGIGLGNLSDEEIKKQYEETYRDFINYNKRNEKLPFGEQFQIPIEEYEFGRLNLLKKEMQKRKIAFSQGGTVPGKGSGFIDSVRAMLAPGEEVIKTTSSMLFRPLLKDINDNAGRLWTLFSQAVLKLIRVSDRQKEVSEEFSKVIKDFDRFVQNEIDKQMVKGKSLAEILAGRSSVYLGGNDRVPTTMTNVSRSFSKPSIRSRSISSSSQSSGGGINFIPMNLPAIQTPPPQIPTPQTTATDVPIISSVNMANPYMQLTPEMYGIFV